MIDEENKSKNRMLIYIVVGVIVFLVLILLIPSCTKKKPDTSMPSCKLVYAREPDSDGVYTKPIEITVEATASNNATVIEKNVGIQENGRRNKEKYTVSKDGETTIIGYVEDSRGKTATCKDTITVRIAVPTCTLEVTEGEPGQNDWYTSSVKVGFAEATSNGSQQITKKSLSISKAKSENTTDSSEETIEIEKTGEYVVTGSIEDSDGNTGTCTLNVNVDLDKPTCTLKKTKEEVVSNKNINVVVEYDIVTDEGSDIDVKGIGLEEDYETEEFKINKRGIFNVNGYVKDKAGNTNTCTLKVDTKSTTEPLSLPTCELMVDGTKNYDDGYCGNVAVKFKTKTSTNGATIVDFGIGTMEDLEKYNTDGTLFLNKVDNIEIVDDTQEVPINYVGMVIDSNDEIETCSLSTKVVPKCEDPTPSCALYQISGVVSGSGIVEAVVGFDESKTYAKGTNKLVKFGLDTAPTNDLNEAREIKLDKPGFYNIYGVVEDNKGNIGKCGPYSVTIIEKSSGSPSNKLLASLVKPGDFVNYNAGKWSGTNAIPSSQGKFGGYASGTTKDTGVVCTNKALIPKNGWVVLSNENGVVKITTSGIPECYYHATENSASNSIRLINGEASKFYNSTYATSASIMNSTDVNSIITRMNGSSNSNDRVVFQNLLLAGDYYYLPESGNSNKTLLSVKYTIGNSMFVDRAGWAQGIRPVVTLKNTVRTTGKKNGVYQLTTASKGIEIDTEKSLYELIEDIVREF